MSDYIILTARLKTIPNAAGEIICADQTCQNILTETMEIRLIGNGFGGTLIVCEEHEINDQGRLTPKGRPA